jgi:hypothetical protein
MAGLVWGFDVSRRWEKGSGRGLSANEIFTLFLRNDLSLELASNASSRTLDWRKFMAVLACAKKARHFPCRLPLLYVH